MTSSEQQQRPLIQERWSDRVDDIFAGDLVAVLAYRTPLGGVVLTPVDPMGMRDPDRGTVAFSSSLAFWKKLRRIEANPRVALCYHTRDHGFSQEPGMVLVQGDATFPSRPSEEWHEYFRRHAPPFIGPLKSGWFWDRLTREYYWVRVPVTIHVRRIIDHAVLDRNGRATVYGAAVPEADAPTQAPPARGVDPRKRVARVARRARRLGNTMLGSVGADGYPEIIPVSVAARDRRGLLLDTLGRRLPRGGRRAGLLSHTFGPHLTKQESRLNTGWLTVTPTEALYAPHTATGLPRTPGRERMLTLIASLAAKSSIRAARARGLVDGDTWIGDRDREEESSSPGRPGLHGM